MKVTFKLLFVFFLALLLMTAVSSYLTVSRIYESYETSHQALLDGVARELEHDLQRAYAVNGPQGVSRVLSERRGVLAALLRDPEISFAAALREEIRLSYAPDAPSREPAIHVDEEGRRILSVYRPLAEGDGKMGALELTGSLESLDRQATDAILQNLAILGVAAILGLTMSYLAGIRWIAKPLARLIDKTNRIGHGDLEGPVEVKTGDELQQLARSMNEMCERIAAQQSAIRVETVEKLSAMEQLRHDDRLKTVGRLAAGIAHELGTPLNVVTGRAGMIAGGGLDPEATRTNAVIIKQESERIAQIVQGLLDFARRRPAQRRETDVVAVARRTCALLEPLAQKYEVTVACRLREAPLTIVVDPAQLQQALTNLVMNAVQASPPGSTVRVVAEERDVDPANLPSIGLRVGSVPAISDPPRRCVAIGVDDDGAGISEGDLAHLVEPFFTTKEVGEGTGLGLAIVYGIVQDHGGWLEVDSTLGRGSSFRIVLPLESPT